MDLYEILGVRKSAGTAEIRRAYQKRARSLHPDLNPGDPAAAEGFRGISQAFEVLSDPPRRAAYDRGASSWCARSLVPAAGARATCPSGPSLAPAARARARCGGAAAT